MERFFHKTKGAISVFLVLILLPVLLFGGLTTDAARIYLSKVVISDAGEMAMNAALAQYNESLLDEYGLLVMDKNPEEYNGEITEFFEKSLNDLPDEEDYSRLLDLVAEDVNAVAVAGSEIYSTEAERQQIIEYMKYRAPLCLTDLILEKLNYMKNVKKQAEAVKAQMDFSKSMKKCQDAIEEAYEALKTAETDNADFKNKYSGAGQAPPDYIQTNLLDAAMYNYQTYLTEIHLMIVAISKFEEASDNDLESMAVSFTNATEDVDIDDAYNCFSEYLACLYYKNGVDNAGGADKIVDDWKAANPEPTDEEEHDAWESELADKEAIVSDYESAKSSISGYSNKLREEALNIINQYSGALSQCSMLANLAGSSASEGLEKLKALKPLIEEAQEKWQTWSDKEEEAFSDDSQKSAKDYQDFFSEEDSAKYDALVSKVEKVELFYAKLALKLDEETFCGKLLDQDSSADQYAAQHNKAEELLAGVTIRLDFEPSDYRDAFKSAYNHTALSPEVPPWSDFAGDAFYTKLKEYAEYEEEEDTGEKNEADNTLSSGGDAGAEAKSTDGYPAFNWNGVENLPSEILAVAAESGGSAMTDVGGDDVKDESLLDKYMDSISAATSFIDGLDSILADTMEDLYVAEYAMQMFSYYTVDKNLDGTDKNADDIISLSGYKMNADTRKAYKAESEYILWGNMESQKNVQATVGTLFGIRLLFNAISTFTISSIRTSAQASAHLICGPAQFLAPFVQVMIQLAYAAVESGNDVKLLKQGKPVTILKGADNWATAPLFKGDSAAVKGVTLSYAEYMRIFLVLKMMVKGDKDTLARIADCIQLNNEYDLTTGYTMVSLNATVKLRTSFMRKISYMDGGPGIWKYADGYYPITYQSVMGY